MASVGNADTQGSPAHRVKFKVGLSSPEPPLGLYLSDERLNAHLKFKWTF